MREKYVELHKSGINGYRKIATHQKMPISTVRAILKKFKATGTVMHLPGSGKSSKIIVGELRTKVASWGRQVSKTTIRCHLHARKKAFPVISPQT